jgi:hypothetical protein
MEFFSFVYIFSFLDHRQVVYRTWLLATWRCPIGNMNSLHFASINPQFLLGPVTNSMISHGWAKNQDISKLTMKKTARSGVNNTEQQATLGTRQKTKTTKYINDTEN